MLLCQFMGQLWPKRGNPLQFSITKNNAFVIILVKDEEQ